MAAAALTRLRERGLTDGFVRALALSQAMALVWWLAALYLRQRGILVWWDQEHTFRASTQFLLNPYTLDGFVHAPWVSFLMIPFAQLSLELGVLIQGMLYFALLTVIIFEFRGSFFAAGLTLTSYVALQAVIEMNVDWFTLIGLIVPASVSPLFLLIKPQLASGYYLGVVPSQWPKIALVGLIVLAVSIVIWGWWPLEIWNRSSSISVPRSFNIAPARFLSWPLSALIGLVLGVLAFRRKDAPLGILAGLFFVPYIAFYSLVIHLAMLAIRWRLLAIILWLSTWVIYGGVIVISLLR